MASVQAESVVSPLGGETVRKNALAPRRATLDGMTIAEVWNEDFKGDIMFPVYREMLAARYKNVKIVPYTDLPRAVLKGTPAYQREVLAEISRALKAKGVDAVISGNGG